MISHNYLFECLTGFLAENIPIFYFSYLRVTIHPCNKCALSIYMPGSVLDPRSSAFNSTNRCPLSWHLHSNGGTDLKQRKENIRIVKSAIRDTK